MGKEVREISRFLLHRRACLPPPSARVSRTSLPTNTTKQFTRFSWGSGKVSVGSILCGGYYTYKSYAAYGRFSSASAISGSAPEKISRSAPVKKARRNGPFLSTVYVKSVS